MPIRVRTRYDEVDRIPDMPERPIFTTPWKVRDEEEIAEQEDAYSHLPNPYIIAAWRMDEIGNIYYLYTNGDVRVL